MGNNFKQGWSEVGGKRYWFRSGFEVRWAQYLELLKRAGEIVDWEYEPHKFEFEAIRSGTVFYIPDFRVFYPKRPSLGGRTIKHSAELHFEMRWHECKGYLQGKDVTKFRRMAKYYPNEKIFLVMQHIPSQNSRSKSAKRTRILLEKAGRCVERIMNGSEILKKVGL